MSYLALARKWRPKNFVDVVGQEHIVRALSNALETERVHHAYLFSGTRGVGKTTVARILAKALNCEAGVSGEPCGECGACISIDEGRFIDLIEVDAASRTKVDDTRELLENVQYAPTRSRYKVYLIDEVHMLSSHSFNALLKTLEEPPPHVKFLLATTDPQKLPATILSRCLQFNLKNMPPEQIVGHLANVLEQEMVSYEEPALWLLGRAAAGSMRDALSLTDQAIAFGSGKLSEADVRSMLGSVDLSFVYQLLEAVSGGEPSALLEVVARMAEHAPDFAASLDELLSLIHRVALAQVVPDAIDNSWGDAERVGQIATAITAEDAQLYYQIALNGKRDIGLAPDPRSGFEMILLRMLAFRPAAVIDETLGPDDLQAVAQPQQQGAAQEVGSAVKKSHEAQTALNPSVPEQPIGLSREAESGSESELAPIPSPLPVVATAMAPEPVPPMPEVEQAAGAFVLSNIEPGNWAALLESLGLVGIVYNIASHCELRSREGKALQFILDSANASLFNDSHSDKIRLALENYFGHPLSVAIVPGEVHTETPAIRKARLAQERQEQAVTSIESDPLLQKLITRFDGELDRSSIAPTDY